MLIRYGYDITVNCVEPTAMVCLLTVREELAAQVQALEQFVATPAIPTVTYRDLFGNICRRFTAPAGDLSLWADSTMEVDGRRDPIHADAKEVPPPDLPNECLAYLLGSRYCETDRLSQIAWDLFQNVQPGWSRVQAICDFAHSHIVFNYQAARSTRTAYEAYQERTGVCRDFAHLAVALLRCMNIPARYVNGYLGDIGVPIVDPMDFSAWIEVYLDCGWVTFDPRNNVPRIGRILVARGRDAADIPLINSYGPHWLKAFRVWAYEIAEPGGYARLADSA